MAEGERRTMGIGPVGASIPKRKCGQEHFDCQAAFQGHCDKDGHSDGTHHCNSCKQHWVECGEQCWRDGCGGHCDRDKGHAGIQHHCSKCCGPDESFRPLDTK